MESLRSRTRGIHVAFGAGLIVALLSVAGCGMSGSSSHSPAPSDASPTPQGSGYTVEQTDGGFVYEDAISGYAVTFPQRPVVQPLANNESDQDAYYVSSSDQESNEFVATGQVLDKTPNLRAQLMGVVGSLNPSGQITAGGYELGGLEAARAQFTTGDGQAMQGYLVGQPGEVVVAGDGNRFYELLALGGTADQRQAFFDSFTRIGD